MEKIYIIMIFVNTFGRECHLEAQLTTEALGVGGELIRSLFFEPGYFLASANTSLFNRMYSALCSACASFNPSLAEAIAPALSPIFS